jgi:hypothetical protein
MTDLVEFLRARLDEDDEAARAAGNRRWLVQDNIIELHPEREDDGFMSWPTRADARHAARWEPARVLREVQAKRQIIDEVMSWRHTVNEEDGWYTCGAATQERDGGECFDERNIGECTCGLDDRRRAILAPLAELYAGQP